MTSPKDVILYDTILRGWYKNLVHSRDVLGLDVGDAVYQLRTDDGVVKLKATAKELIEYYEGVDN